MNLKRIQNPITMLILLALALSVGLPTAHAQEGSPALFNDATPPSDVLEQEVPSHVVRSRYVSVNLGLLQDTASQEGADQSGQELTFNLFSDAVYNGIVDRVEKTAADSTSWIGKLTNQANGYFYLVTSGDIFIAHFASPDGIYEVSWVADDLYRVVEIDQAQLGEDAPGEYAPSGEIISQSDLGPTADDGSMIDVMVIYTDDARKAEGSRAAMRARINLAMTETNDAYANAGIIPRLNLVHTDEVSYPETGSMSIDLTRFRNKNDGYMDNIHALRDLYGADMVALVVENADACGLASTIMASAGTAFQVTARDGCMTGYYSFGHEFGHLQGAGHDHAAHGGYYVNSEFSYGHGYVYTPSLWRTVMAYNTACSPSYCTRLQYWSNPNVNYMSVPTGTSNDEENYRVLNETAATVANFRPHLSDDAMPIYPRGKKTDRTPTYRFTKANGATRYQIQLREGIPIIYNVTVLSGKCGVSDCKTTPKQKLSNGVYRWRVREKVGGVWQSWSAFKRVEIISSEFNHNFNNSHPGWKTVTGAWSHINSKFYRGTTATDSWGTLQYKDKYKNGTFVVRMKRLGCSSCSSGIFVRGIPTPLAPFNRWDQGYLFNYTNNGNFSIWRMEGSSETALVGWTASPAIRKGKWNVLKVVFSGNTMKFYINGTLVANVSDSLYKRAFLGIGFYRDIDSTGNRLLIDNVKLTGGFADPLPFEEVLEGQPLSGGTMEQSP
jgi:hypothetical protein